MEAMPSGSLARGRSTRSASPAGERPSRSHPPPRAPRLPRPRRTPPRKSSLAFDLGAESGRAVLGTLDSGKLTLAEKHRFLNPTGRINGHLHWNLVAQWEELKTGLRKAAFEQHADHKDPVAIHGIGVDTWGV